MGWFQCSGNTANLGHHVFHILFLTLLKTFFTPFPFPQAFNLARLLPQKHY